MLLTTESGRASCRIVAALQDDHARELRDHHEGGRPRRRLSHPGKGVRVVSTYVRIARSIKRQRSSANNKMRPKASMRSGFFRRGY